MPLWIPYFLTALGMYIFAHGVPNAPYDFYEECNKLRKKTGIKLCILIVLGILVSICAFKSISANAVDEYAYRIRFDSYDGLSFKAAMNFCEGEYINGFLVWISTVMFKTNQGIFIVFGTLTALFYTIAINKYSRDYSFAIALLMMTGVICTSFNITQQSLACAILVCFSDTIYKRRFWKFIVVVLVCFFIHKASIFILVFYIFSSPKFASGKGKYYIVLFCAFFILLYKNVGLLAQKFPMLEQYVDIVEDGSRAGINGITILINCVPAMVAILYLNKINEEDLITGLSVNMCFMHAAIYIAGIFDRYIARLGMFTSPFVIIFLSRSADLFENKKYLQMYKLLAILFYSIELFLRITDYRFVYNFSF